MSDIKHSGVGNRGSKLIFQRELDYAWVRGRRRDSAERWTGCRILGERIAVPEVDVRVRKLRCIGQVQELRPEAHAMRLSYRKDLLHRKVDIVLPGAAHDADAAVTEILIGKAGAVDYFGRPRESRWIEILSRNASEDRTMRQRVCSGAMRAVLEIPVNRAGVGIHDGQRGSRLDHAYPRESPIGKQPPRMRRKVF